MASENRASLIANLPPPLEWRSESIARIRRFHPHPPFFFSRDFHFRSILTTVKRKRREGGPGVSREIGRDDANRLGGKEQWGEGEGEARVVSRCERARACNGR